MAECRTCGATFHVGDRHDCPGPPPNRYLLLDLVIGFVAGGVIGPMVSGPLAELTDPTIKPFCTAGAIAVSFLFMRTLRRSQRN